MTRQQTLIAFLVAVAIVGFVVLAATGHPGDGVYLVGAVPALIGLVVSQQIATGHEARTVEHVDTIAKLNTIDSRVYQVEKRVAALSNGELQSVIAAGTAEGLATHLQTSSIVEQPFQGPTFGRRSDDPATVPAAVVEQLSAVEAAAAKSRP